MPRFKSEEEVLRLLGNGEAIVVLEFQDELVQYGMPQDFTSTIGCYELMCNLSGAKQFLWKPKLVFKGEFIRACGDKGYCTFSPKPNSCS